MKTKFLLPLCISVVMGAMVFISCEHEQIILNQFRMKR